MIDGAHWSGPDVITVEPQQSKNYELVYKPLVMTHEGRKHQVCLCLCTSLVAFLFLLLLFIVNPTLFVRDSQSVFFHLGLRRLIGSSFTSLQGSVFFALPDGNGLLYNVTGIAEPPKAVSNIQRDVPCKTNYTELLTVTNWLRTPQR